MNKKLLYLTSTSGVIALITGIYLIKQYKDLKTTFNKHLNPAIFRKETTGHTKTNFTTTTSTSKIDSKN